MDYNTFDSFLCHKTFVPDSNELTSLLEYYEDIFVSNTGEYKFARRSDDSWDILDSENNVLKQLYGRYGIKRFKGSYLLRHEDDKGYYTSVVSTDGELEILHPMRIVKLNDNDAILIGNGYIYKVDNNLKTLATYQFGKELKDGVQIIKNTVDGKLNVMTKYGDLLLPEEVDSIEALPDCPNIFVIRLSLKLNIIYIDKNLNVHFYFKDFVPIFIDTQKRFILYKKDSKEFKIDFSEILKWTSEIDINKTQN